MQVHALSATGFRNLETLSIEPHPRFNVFFGNNGQGKTNLLEAVYVLATLRSFRSTRLEELLRFGAEAVALRARVEHRGVDRVFGLEIQTKPLRKQALCDGKIARTREYFGGFNVVLFSPEDLRIPHGPPGGRRSFLDRAIWNTWPGYLDEVRLYERLLKTRNAVLRQDRGATGAPLLDAQENREALLDIYDERLAQAGAVLMQRRRRYVTDLAPRVRAAFTAISGTAHEVTVRYEASLRDKDAEPKDEQSQGDRLRQQLQRDRKRDLLRGFTHAGPHADDLRCDLDGRAAETHASQGQTRALVLSLKIAEIQHLQQVLQDAPILLLDDVSSELDREKNAALFAFLSEIDSQVFLTTTDPRHIHCGASAADRQDFAVRRGAVQAETFAVET